MKGFAFAANIIIVVAIGVIVLLGVIALFYPTFSSGSQGAIADSAKNAACNVLVSRRCKELTKNVQVSDVDADKDGIFGETAANGDNLFLLCRNYYGIECTSTNNGDMNSDCIVESNDLNIVSSAFGSWCDETSCVGGSCWGDYSTCTVTGNWDPRADITGPENPPGSGIYPPDGAVSAADFGEMSDDWNTYDPSVESSCKKLCGCTSV